MAFAVFAVLFLFHISPIGLGDVYWHLNTGRWIWENGALPDSDPFTYTQAVNPDAQPGLHSHDYWQRLILQGYWLAQLLFFAVYTAFGPWGLVVLKALLFLTLYWLVWRAMLKAHVEPLSGLLAILLMPWLLFRYDELRPHIFSFIGVVLVYTNISSALSKLRSGVALPVDLILLPLIMLLWANLHPGFILGWVIIIVMLAGAAFDRWRGINALELPALRRLLIWCGIALLASLANPLGYAFITNIGVLQEQYSLGVDEFLPLAEYARMYQQPVLFYGALAIALATMGVLLLRWKHTDPARVFLLFGFTAAGFSAFRYMIFFVLISLMIVMPHVLALSKRYIDRARPLLIAFLLAGMSGLGYLIFQHDAWKQGAVQTNYVPERAAEWILNQHPPPPLFNAYEYGGYLGWRLTPDYRMFIDPRCLDIEIFNDYQIARGGHYQGIFDKYGVNSVVFYFLTPPTNSIPEVALYLLMDNRWDMVYVDKLTVVVLVRHDRNYFPVMDKLPLLEYLQRVLERKLATAPEDTQAHVEYGRILWYRGNVVGAREHFKAALQIDPQQQAPRLYLEAIMRQKK
jgi:hypothetical protein